MIEADTGTQGLLDRYALSKLRAALQLEGWQYSLGDFVVRAARVVQAPQQQFLGLVLDVVYQPLSHTGPAEAAILQASVSLGLAVRSVIARVDWPPSSPSEMVVHW